MSLERSPILKVHRLIKPCEVCFTIHSWLPEHVANHIRTITSLTLLWCWALISAPVAVRTQPVERVEVIHARDDRPVIVTVRHQFDIKAFINRTVPVDLHDVFGARESSAFIHGGALPDGLSMMDESHLRMIGDDRIRPGAIQNGDDFCVTLHVLKDSLNRFRQKHFVAGGNDNGKIGCKLHS